MQRPSSLRSAPYTGPEWPHSTVVAGAGAEPGPSVPRFSGSGRAPTRAARSHTRTDESAKQPAGRTAHQEPFTPGSKPASPYRGFPWVHAQDGMHCELTHTHEQATKQPAKT